MFFIDIWWIKELNLYMADKECIVNGSEVSDNVINVTHIFGFQNTLLGYSVKFLSISNVPAIQILHTGTCIISSIDFVIT